MVVRIAAEPGAIGDEWPLPAPLERDLMDDNVNRRWFLKVAGAAAASGRAIPAWGQESARIDPTHEWQFYGGD
jgi:hypothetical protein